MKTAGLIVWLLAILLLAGILKRSPDSANFNESMTSPARRSLLVIAAPQHDNKLSVPARPSAGGCSRLGTFPRREWADHVAALLTEGGRPDSGEQAMPANWGSDRPWRVQRIGLDAYYLQFDAWSVDELAERITRQRNPLRRLLSTRSMPEPCDQ